MKIIKPGSLPEERSYTATCYHCGAIVEFKRKEARIFSDQRDGTSLTVACPTCTKPITVDA